MSELQDLFNEAGSVAVSEWNAYDLALFKVVAELVYEIERLRTEIKSLERVLHSRTDHLA